MEMNQNERRRLVTAALDALHQLRSHLTTTLTGLKTAGGGGAGGGGVGGGGAGFGAGGDPGVSIRPASAHGRALEAFGYSPRRHRWGVRTKGERFGTMVIKLEAPSPLAFSTHLPVTPRPPSPSEHSPRAGSGSALQYISGAGPRGTSGGGPRAKGSPYDRSPLATPPIVYASRPTQMQQMQQQPQQPWPPSGSALMRPPSVNLGAHLSPAGGEGSLLPASSPVALTLPPKRYGSFGGSSGGGGGAGGLSSPSSPRRTPQARVGGARAGSSSGVGLLTPPIHRGGSTSPAPVTKPPPSTPMRPDSPPNTEEGLAAFAAADAAAEAIAKARAPADLAPASRPASAHLLVPARPPMASVLHRGSHLSSKVGAMMGSNTQAAITSPPPPALPAMMVGTPRGADAQDGGAGGAATAGGGTGTISARPHSARAQLARIASAGPLKSGPPGLAAEDSPEFAVTAGREAAVRATKYA